MVERFFERGGSDWWPATVVAVLGVGQPGDVEVELDGKGKRLTLPHSHVRSPSGFKAAALAKAAQSAARSGRRRNVKQRADAAADVPASASASAANGAGAADELKVGDEASPPATRRQAGTGCR
jgi:hypothetical protein